MTTNIVTYKCEFMEWDDELETYICPYKEMNEDRVPFPLQCPKSSLINPRPTCMMVHSVKEDWDH